MILKRICGWTLFLLPAIFVTNIQAQKKTARNFIGGITMYDASNISIAGAAELERWLLVKNKWVLSAKGNYVFPHKTFNAIFYREDLVKSNQQVYAMATGYFFPGMKNKPEGFYISLGFGVNHTWYETKVYADYSNPQTIKNTKFSAGHEFSMGGHFNFKQGGALRISAGIANFYSKPETQYPEFLPIVLIFSKVSVGF
jgi:hypothetical protein